MRNILQIIRKILEEIVVYFEDSEEQKKAWNEYQDMKARSRMG